MSNFFAPDEVYKKRIAICKSCDHYFKPTGNCKMCGCFMKLKARISMMDCPKQYWTCFEFGNTKQDAKQVIPKELINEVIELYPQFKTGRASNQEVKRRMITLYNVIFSGHFNVKTSCSGCLQTVWSALGKIYNENQPK